MDTEAIAAIVQEMADLKRDRQQMEQPGKELEEKIQRCLNSKEELAADFVSEQALRLLTFRTALAKSSRNFRMRFKSTTKRTTNCVSLPLCCLAYSHR